MKVNIDKNRMERDLAKMLGCFWGWERNPRTMQEEGGWYKRIGVHSCACPADWGMDLLNLAFETFLPRELV